jgi:2-amino-4-hydroxy-6-hydroxymethyldihydropteridine diphosphokinase
LAWAIEQLQDLIADLRVSSIHETDPVGVPDRQPTYLNAAAVGETDLTPEALLAALMDIEQRRGRKRRSFRAARTLDLDLLLYDDRIIRTAALEVPHPRFRDRLFVLEPLNEVAPDWVDPVTGKTIGQLCEGQRAKGKGQREGKGPKDEGRRT